MQPCHLAKAKGEPSSAAIRECLAPHPGFSHHRRVTTAELRSSLAQFTVFSRTLKGLFRSGVREG